MSTENEKYRYDALTMAAETIDYVLAHTMTPADWELVSASLQRMRAAVDRGDLDQLRQEREGLEALGRRSRQKAEARLDPAQVEAPPPQRSAAENLSRTIKEARPAKDEAEPSR